MDTKKPHIKWYEQEIFTLGIPEYIINIFNSIQFEVLDENKINNRALDQVFPDDSIWVSYPLDSSKEKVSQLIFEYISRLELSFQDVWMLYPADLEYIWPGSGKIVARSENNKLGSIYPNKAEKIESIKMLQKVAESAFDGGMGNLVIFLTPNLTIDFDEHAFNVVARNLSDKLKIWNILNFLNNKYKIEFNTLNNRKNVDLIKI